MEQFESLICFQEYPEIFQIATVQANFQAANESPKPSQCSQVKNFIAFGLSPNKATREVEISKLVKPKIQSGFQKKEAGRAANVRLFASAVITESE